MKRMVSGLATLVLFGAGMGPVQAGTIALTFNSLPSAQGWTYDAFHNSNAETDVFSVNGVRLHQDTVGKGFQFTGGANVYRLDGVVNPTQPFTLAIRARVTAEEQVPTQPFNHEGFSWFVFTGTEAFGAAMGTKETDIPSGPNSTNDPLFMDNTKYHDFLLAGTPGVGWQLFVDGVLRSFGPAAPDTNPMNPDGLWLGDTTGGANATADVAHYVFTQPALAVPEPASLPLLALGSLGLLALRRRRR